MKHEVTTIILPFKDYKRYDKDFDTCEMVSYIVNLVSVNKYMSALILICID